MEKKINLLIAYDQQLVADGLKVLIANESHLNLMDCIQNGHSVFESLQKTEPDILILELARWPCHYLDYIKNIASGHKDLKLVIISEKILHRSLVKVMNVAKAYLLRTCSFIKVKHAIAEINRMDRYICSQEIDEFIKSEQEEIPNLTSREVEILTNWLISGNNSQVATTLNISESTVRTHLKNIRQKINCASNIQMMVYACKNNISNPAQKPLCPNCRYSCATL